METIITIGSCQYAVDLTPENAMAIFRYSGTGDPVEPLDRCVE